MNCDLCYEGKETETILKKVKICRDCNKRKLQFQVYFSYLLGQVKKRGFKSVFDNAEIWTPEYILKMLDRYKIQNNANAKRFMALCIENDK